MKNKIYFFIIISVIALCAASTCIGGEVDVIELPPLDLSDNSDSQTSPEQNAPSPAPEPIPTRPSPDQLDLNKMKPLDLSRKTLKGKAAFTVHYALPTPAEPSATESMTHYYDGKFVLEFQLVEAEDSVPGFEVYILREATLQYQFSGGNSGLRNYYTWPGRDKNNEYTAWQTREGTGTVKNIDPERIKLVIDRDDGTIHFSIDYFDYPVTYRSGDKYTFSTEKTAENAPYHGKESIIVHYNGTISKDPIDKKAGAELILVKHYNGDTLKEKNDKLITQFTTLDHGITESTVDIALSIMRGQ